MAAASLSALGALMKTQAAGVATAMGGAATTANVQALADLIVALGGKPNMAIPVMALTPNVQILPS